MAKVKEKIEPKQSLKSLFVIMSVMVSMILGHHEVIQLHSFRYDYDCSMFAGEWKMWANQRVIYELQPQKPEICRFVPVITKSAVTITALDQQD